MNKKIFIFSKRGELAFEAENIEGDWIVFPYKESRILDEREWFNEEDFEFFLEKCKRYYPILNPNF